MSAGLEKKGNNQNLDVKNMFAGSHTESALLEML
jgi:hypothetical protein